LGDFGFILHKDSRIWKIPGMRGEYSTESDLLGEVGFILNKDSSIWKIPGMRGKYSKEAK